MWAPVAGTAIRVAKGALSASQLKRLRSPEKRYEDPGRDFRDRKNSPPTNKGAATQKANQVDR